MKKVVVTGGNGFIGRHLVSVLTAAGHETISLPRSDWRLGAPLPPVCDDADAIVHLASAVLNSQDRQAAAALDLEGTTVLLQQNRNLRATGRRKRFIFVSSQSAREGAGNDYGRSKWAIERLLDQHDEFVLRPGLVYDRGGGSVFGVFESMARLPVVPIISRRPCIQPIDVGELAAALVRLIETDSAPRLLQLGAPVPLTLGDMVRAVAERSGRRPPLAVPFPALPLRLVAWLADAGLKLSPPLLERVDGLLALRPMDTAPSLAALGLSLAPFGQART